MFELEDKVALVTGAGQNVGAGIARLLAEQGAAVAVNDIRPERAADTVAAIEAAGGRAVAIGFDVTDHQAVAAGVAEVEGTLGPVDVLVNNAGNGGAEGMRPTQFRESDPASWRGPIDVNLYGVLNCSHAVINGMCERGWGRIITIASGAGLVGLNIGVSPYAAGKGGAIGFMRHLAIENARYGVTANTLAIGLMTNEDQSVTEALARQIPTKRTGVPEDIGYACVYLASPEAEWVTGQTIQINGGSVTT
ncbi:SDR family NAD(P)-dependent oxidoreductase [Rhabdothermincola salaria]|uniref:SDR family NAD(P)-dependent oxidoreductase n=1 Tax=Rhabdothermincola salaria TaxID=2903142 RepID=UPI001E57F6A2|nr:SDR family oxidoreductase [Rhabdothermincola salaria]